MSQPRFRDLPRYKQIPLRLFWKSYYTGVATWRVLHWMLLGMQPTDLFTRRVLIREAYLCAWGEADIRMNNTIPLHEFLAQLRAD